ncbi:DUF3526 domain-containing protein [Elizabethkingia meningoseptica]|uniref:DUF3526 domain-containing protein n=1 Tax=Elizabethkingia meningoseptica TaxID=238 RepID=UPI000332CCC8|nr:DUF3526 domain-containing protein [Elizabethkingia meningoseptica]AQX05994.1 ABC transporter permease [Elizabethkingia meningoseptica]AQX48040.1 ABC transporter permease [Elizabethkingia meningoseptica]EJK5327568.1 DUF3526 domain-containing protein [Elizabethkingia meningoseptica]EOR30966.1 hypothetical protein L100_03301 [Elizabethkingia meningoseptica ATCC 13253 = NBRC 12535]KUY23228.1 ABC transporter permease [Elizabethkingia meningoseptica]
MYTLLFKNFFRTRSAYLGLIFLLLSGVVSLYIGKQFLDKQESNVLHTAQYQQEHIQRYVKYFDKESGLLLYYLKFGLVNKTDNLNGLSIGQRDLNPSVQSLTIRNLEGQKYDTDLNNPVSLLFGNLDLGFVIIFLFPLVIISFCYNILSEEKEDSTWTLLSVQSQKPVSILFKKLEIRFVAVAGVLFVLIFLAVIMLELPLNVALLGFVLVSLLYLVFWFALSFWIVSWNKNSSISAASLLSFWIILILILPALLNNYILNKYPLPEALDTVIEQREGYHEKWDTDKKATLEKFYKHYPQFESFGYPKESFTWLWYYAMQQMGDDESKAQSDLLHQKLWKREKMSRNLSYFVPGLHTQLQFNELTRSGLSNQLKFIEKTGEFHEKNRLYFYPEIFGNEPVSSINWDSFKLEYYHENDSFNWFSMLVPLIIFCLLLGFLSITNFRKPLLS